MGKATITFDTELTADELGEELTATGILALMATRLGAYPVVTVDHDQEA